MCPGAALKIKAHRYQLAGVDRCGRNCTDLRLRVEAIFGVHTGTEWRDLPARLGPWSVYAVFRSWTHNGLRQALLTTLNATARDDESIL